MIYPGKIKIYGIKTIKATIKNEVRFLPHNNSTWKKSDVTLLENTTRHRTYIR